MTAAEVLGWLQRTGTAATVAGMTRYGIPNDRAFGVPMGEMQKYAKRLGKDHALAAELWTSGWYEARTVAVLLAEAGKLTGGQMDAWARDFDSWAICDTACFHLFDRSSHAWEKVRPWARMRPEFHKRAAFALMWGLSVHDKTASDASFLECLPLIEEAAADDRNFVKKAVDMALRAIGKRNGALNAAARETAERLAASAAGTPRWVGKHALRELTSPGVRDRLQRREAKSG
jgi:3-methyladenine DNA glycosylase AlkD